MGRSQSRHAATEDSDVRLPRSALARKRGRSEHAVGASRGSDELAARDFVQTFIPAARPNSNSMSTR